MIGSVTEIAGQRVLIAGVVSRDSWHLPGQVDAWLLEDERHLDNVAGERPGDSCWPTFERPGRIPGRPDGDT